MVWDSFLTSSWQKLLKEGEGGGAGRGRFEMR